MYKERILFNEYYTFYIHHKMMLKLVTACSRDIFYEVVRCQIKGDIMLCDWYSRNSIVPSYSYSTTPKVIDNTCYDTWKLCYSPQSCYFVLLSGQWIYVRTIRAESCHQKYN